MTSRRSLNYQSENIETLWRALGGCCYICFEKLSRKGITKDHVFPKSEGYSISCNMMPAHFECNSEKGNRFPTLAEIEIAELVHESVGLVFSPRLIAEAKLITKPIEYYINSLREAA